MRKATLSLRRSPAPDAMPIPLPPSPPPYRKAGPTSAAMMAQAGTTWASARNARPRKTPPQNQKPSRPTSRSGFSRSLSQ